MVRGSAGIFRLAAIDLDGTLLRSDGTIGERTKRAARETTLDIVLVTARGPLTMRGSPASSSCRRSGDEADLRHAEHDTVAIQDLARGVALVLERLSAA